MEITIYLKNEILTNSKTIENIEVLYKKKEKFSGKLSFVNHDPFEIKVYDEEKDEAEAEHYVYFGRALEITINYSDGTIKVFKDTID